MRHTTDNRIRKRIVDLQLRRLDLVLGFMDRRAPRRSNSKWCCCALEVPGPIRTSEGLIYLRSNARCRRQFLPVTGGSFPVS